MIVGKVKLRNWRWKSRRSVAVDICRRRSRRAVTVAILLGAEVVGNRWPWDDRGHESSQGEVSSEGGVTSGTAECSQRDERLRERLNVLRRRSGLEKALGLSQLREDTRTFFLDPPCACWYIEFVAYSGYSWRGRTRIGILMKIKIWPLLNLKHHYFLTISQSHITHYDLSGSRRMWKFVF